MKLVSVVGMPQSGSTLFFNIVRSILTTQLKKETLTSLYTSTAVVGGFSKSSGVMGVINKGEIKQFLETGKFYVHTVSHSPETLLIKEHHFDDFLNRESDIVFICKRDLSDCIVSRRRRGKKLNSKGQIQKGVVWPTDKKKMFEKYCTYLTKDCFTEWISPKSIVLDYDEYCLDHRSVIKKIGSGFNISLTEAQVNTVIKDATQYNDFETYATGFTPSKVTNKEIPSKFTKEEADFIDKHCSDFTAKDKKENPTPALYRKTKYKKHNLDSDRLSKIFFNHLAREGFPYEHLSYGILTFLFLEKDKNHLIPKINQIILTSSTVNLKAVTDKELKRYFLNFQSVLNEIIDQEDFLIERFVDQDGKLPEYSEALFLHHKLPDTDNNTQARMMIQGEDNELCRV